MEETSRHDAWTAGDSYDAYMGRWSRKIAPQFVDWLETPEDLEWLDVGCGTGALSEAIVSRAAPRDLISVDASEGFVATARRAMPDPRAEFRVGDAQALPFDSASRDVVVSGLMLNFVPDKTRALAEMNRVTRPGGTIGFYVWDYPGGGVEFMRAFWDAAAALDPEAEALSERRRFPGCTPDGLRALVLGAGLPPAECTSIETPTVFRDFDDLWRPFTLGAGPAPGYCVALDPDARLRLRDRLEADLPRGENGTILLKARAWALKTVAA
ncbi:MAG: class I SAM-dependent methyltransferase [Rhodobacteraceae bacterium]|nr:class I SAM-dependent methyltransferase [Paracoccaceae bacterium]